MEWKKVGENSSTPLEVSVATSRNHFVSTLKLKGDIALNNSSYVCETKRTTQEPIKCISKVINVLYAVSGNATVNKTVDDEIHCYANTSQSCSYHWKWLQDNDFTIESSTSVLKARKPGWHRCQAEYYLRNQMCNLLVMRVLVYDVKESRKPSTLVIVIVVDVIVGLMLVGVSIFVSIWIIRISGPNDRMRQLAEVFGQPQAQMDISEGNALLKEEHPVKINFDVIPSFVKTIRTKAAKTDSKGIFGLTILNGDLFIINKHSPDVEVYDSQSLAFKHQFHLEGLYDPVDIKSSSKNACIYIFGWYGESSGILRVASDGKLITKWKTGNEGGYISVTLEANVILSAWDKNLLKEFTADGQLLHEIQLSASISELRLAIKLSNGHFIISQGESEQSEHRVCLVDEKGAVLKSIGGKQGSSNGEFYNPNYLVVDGSGFILVADQNNRRVVLLSPDLEFKNEVIQERDDLRYPVRMDLDRASGRLFVADNDYLEDYAGWRDGRVLAFDFTIHH